ncbi:MAG TPA: hypothetical protein VKR83_14640, partial [Ktedonobacteraceae bacterium]|nr:hypothetical protein [Ktedonobacteraceae bacterium]
MDAKVTYRQQVSFCGKSRCRKCRDGIGHGPYWYAYRLTADGRKERIYIGRHLPPEAATDQNNREGSPGTVAPVDAGFSDIPTEQYSEIDALDHLLVVDPTNETILQRLVLALARTKRRGEALR